jgi:hypothetical protein
MSRFISSAGTSWPWTIAAPVSTLMHLFRFVDNTLQARREVRRLANNAALLRRARSDQDADDHQPCCALQGRVGLQATHNSHQLQPRTHGSFCVVLVSLRVPGAPSPGRGPCLEAQVRAASQLLILRLITSPVRTERARHTDIVWELQGSSPANRCRKEPSIRDQSTQVPGSQHRAATAFPREGGLGRRHNNRPKGQMNLVGSSRHSRGRPKWGREPRGSV